MTVRTTDRSQSRAEYVNKVRQLNQDIGFTVANGPRKYVPTYGDRMITTALDAYMEVIAANSIYPSKYLHAEHDYLQRRGHLLEARAKIEAVAAMCDIYFEMLMSVDHESVRGKDKAMARMERIGLLCTDARKLITGVINSDARRFRQYNRKSAAPRM